MNLRIPHISNTALSLFLIVIQSCGLRYFEGISYVLTIFIIGLNFKTLFRLSARDFLFIALVDSLIILLSWYHHIPVKNSIYFCSILFVATLLSVTYREYGSQRCFVDDFYTVSKFLTYNAAIGYVLYLLLSPLFVYYRGAAYPYYTILGFFNVTANYIVGFLPRNTGLLWEPGLLQLFVNMYLLLSIVKGKSSFKKMIFLSVLVLTTNSTTGFLNLFFIWIYYFYRMKKLSFGYVIMVITIGIALIPLVVGNVEDKLVGEGSDSGKARTRDMIVGGELILQSPIMGHGAFDGEYLRQKTFIEYLEEELFGEFHMDENGIMYGGYTNGLLDILIIFGLPIGLLLIYMFSNNLLFFKRSELCIFDIICITTFFSEPITRTSFFFLLAFSKLIVFHYSFRAFKWGNTLSESFQLKEKNALVVDFFKKKCVYYSKD